MQHKSLTVIQQSLVLFLERSNVYNLLPMEEISSVLFPLEQKDEVQTYDEAEEYFNTDYDRENPVTRREALEEFAKRK